MARPRTAALLALMTMTATSVRIAGADPTAQKKQTAKEYVSAGLAAQKSGDNDTAITFYSKAYDLVPNPVLLFNMAQANRLGGHVDQALELYKRYLAADPKGAEAKIARELVAEIEAIAEAKRKADAAKHDDELRAEAARKADEAKRADDARNAAAAAAHKPDTAPAIVQPIPPPPPPDDPGRTLRIAGLATGIGGVVLVGVGIGFGAHAHTLSNELSEPDVTFDPSKVSAGQAANRDFLIATIAGGVLIAGGAVLYVRGRSARASGEHLAILPMIVVGGGGLALGGTLP